ncbi:hypothetical protein [Ellagibacter isourolithinifaciens]|uniref:hypothetical protein n=1 Tax=Ellagibacter isourolithinifaciens TaxID=2137581 RepID=UPI003A8D28FF
MTEESEKERIEKDDTQATTGAQAEKPWCRALMGGVAAAALVAACAVGAIVGQAIIGQGAVQQAKPAESQQASQPSANEPDAHETAEHVWQPEYSVVHVEKRTHMEHRDATYKQVTVNETVCNDCKAVITGKAQEHIEKTGHSGFTRNVPVVEDVVDVPAHDEEVVDWEAHDERRLTGYSCECGKKLTLDEAKEAGVYSEADEHQGDDKAARE